MLKRAPFLDSLQEDNLNLLLYCQKDLLKKEFFLLKNFKNFIYPVLKVQATKKLTTKWLYSEIYSNTELVKHWTFKQLGLYVIEKISRKSSSLLMRLNLLFIKAIYSAFNKYQKYLAVASPLMPNIPMKGVGELSKLGRTRKKKRSIRRSYRSRLFFSKRGRIWLT